MILQLIEAPRSSAALDKKGYEASAIGSAAHQELSSLLGRHSEYVAMPGSCPSAWRCSPPRNEIVAPVHAVGEMGWASRHPRLLSNIGRPAIRVVQISVCSEISKASSTSMPRYLTVDSSLEWPNSSCTARRFFVRR